MRILFRIDASENLGSGHLFRCLTLANELRSHGVEILFICREHAHHSYIPLINNGYDIKLLKQPKIRHKNINNDNNDSTWLGLTWQQDCNEVIQVLENSEPFDWVIVDHYGIDYHWHDKIRPFVRKIMVIDDLANRSLNCDLLLNQTYLFNRKQYDNYLPLHSKKLIGSKYAILRPEFYELRKKALIKRNKMEQINNILIFMATMDRDNSTMDVLTTLKEIKWNIRPNVRLVLGKHAPNIEAIKDCVERHTLQIDFQTDVTNMEELILEADIAIGSGGMHSWERCSLGLPTLITAFASNQQANVSALHEAGAAVYWKNKHDLSMAITNVINNRDLVLQMQTKAAAICDGLGTKRIVEVILNEK